MAKPRAIILDGGRAQILNAAVGVSAFIPHSFVIGDAAGFVPTRQELLQRGTKVFEGDVTLMENRVQTVGVARYTVSIPEGEGPFDVGNAILYTLDSEGEIVPFAMVVLPYAVKKKVSEYELADSNYPVPGHRFVIAITVKHELVEQDNDAAIVVEVISPEYANLAFFPTEASVPEPDLNPHAQFVINRHLLSGTPTFATKGDDGRYWAMPFLTDLRHPKYTVLDGGASGDGYRDEGMGFLWGHRFDTPDNVYKGVIGGADFDLSENVSTFTVGGGEF